jgi:beta-glucosidase
LHAPGLNGKVFGKRAAHNLLLAHGLAMQVLQEQCPQSRNGIVLNFSPCYPATNGASDIAAAKHADDTFNQWYIKPIIEGRYPDLLANLPSVQMPEIHDGDLEIISTPIDFLGVNYYTRAIYRADGEEAFVQLPPNAPLTDMGWEIFPRGLTDTLVALNDQYELPPIFITESGAAMSDLIDQGEVNDTDRIQYIQSHLDAVDDAIEHGVRIDGYFCWSLMDNFEWAYGYEKRFGIVYVDFATQERITKASGRAYRDLLGRRKLETAKTVQD